MPVRMLSSLSMHHTRAPFMVCPAVLCVCGLASGTARPRASGTRTLNTLPLPGQERTSMRCLSTWHRPSAIARPRPRPFSARVW
ncbi:hypothetical protein D3C86_1510860 [compost metagenome]